MLVTVALKIRLGKNSLTEIYALAYFATVKTVLWYRPAGWGGGAYEKPVLIKKSYDEREGK
jgi:hypothetical protein